LPGGGHTTSGAPVQNKVLVVGELNVTWKNSTGIDFTAGAGGGDDAAKVLGLETLDFVDFEFASTDGAAPADEKLYLFALNRNTDFLFGFEDIGQGTSAAPSDTDVIVITYMAVGDALAADLT